MARIKLQGKTVRRTQSMMAESPICGAGGITGDSGVRQVPAKLISANSLCLRSSIICRAVGTNLKQSPAQVEGIQERSI